LPAYWEEAKIWLMRRDRIMKKLIGQCRSDLQLVGYGKPFVTLVRAIIGQQLSIKAADAVWNRFLAICPECMPAEVMDARNKLADCGLSRRKAEYILGLADHFQAKRVQCGKWATMKDEEVIADLVQIRGIGRWTAEMFLIFNLLRPNALPLDDAGLSAQDIGLIVVATSTSENLFPSTACQVQAALGCSQAGAFDVQAACTGFIYALSAAEGWLISGRAKHALVIGAETFSTILDWNDRRTCILFGDGAGAVVLTASKTPGITGIHLGADGTQGKILYAQAKVAHGQITGDPFVRMDGQAVFKQAVTVLERSAREVCAEAGVRVEDVDWLVPHQANIRIMQATAKKLRLPMEKVIVTVAEHGNTSAASIGLALDCGVRAGHIRCGQTLLLEGVGGGFTWGAVLLRM